MMFAEAFSVICKYGLLTSTLFTFHGRTCHNNKLTLRCPLDTSISIQWAHYGVVHSSLFRCKELEEEETMRIKNNRLNTKQRHDFGAKQRHDLTSKHRKEMSSIKRKAVNSNGNDEALNRKNRGRSSWNSRKKIGGEVYMKDKYGNYYKVDDEDDDDDDDGDDDDDDEVRTGVILEDDDDDVTLRNLGIKDCLARSSLKVVTDTCENKQRCRLRASDSFFNESPCPFSQLEVGYQCVPEFHSKTTACLGTQLYLQCPSPYRILILSANYGYKWPGEIKCSEHPGFDTECTSVCSTYVVTTKCHGRRSCTLFVDSKLFGDPCVPGTQPYLTVYYACVPGRILKKRINKKTFPFNECVNPPSNSSYFSGIDVFQPIFHTTTIAFDPDSGPKWYVDYQMYVQWLYAYQFIRDNLEKALLCALVSSLIGLTILLLLIIIIILCRIKTSSPSTQHHRIRPVFLDHTDHLDRSSFRPFRKVSRGTSQNRQIRRMASDTDDIEGFRGGGMSRDGSTQHPNTSRLVQQRSRSSEPRGRKATKRKSNLLDHLSSFSGGSLQSDERQDHPSGPINSPQIPSRITSPDRFSLNSPHRFANIATADVDPNPMQPSVTFPGTDDNATYDNNVIYDNNNDSPVFIHVDSPRESPLLAKSNGESNGEMDGGRDGEDVDRIDDWVNGGISPPTREPRQVYEDETMPQVYQTSFKTPSRAVSKSPHPTISPTTVSSPSTIIETPTNITQLQPFDKPTQPLQPPREISQINFKPFDPNLILESPHQQLNQPQQPDHHSPRLMASTPQTPSLQIKRLSSPWVKNFQHPIYSPPTKQTTDSPFNFAQKETHPQKFDFESHLSQVVSPSAPPYSPKKDNSSFTLTPIPLKMPRLEALEPHKPPRHRSLSPSSYLTSASSSHLPSASSHPLSSHRPSSSHHPSSSRPPLSLLQPPLPPSDHIYDLLPFNLPKSHKPPQMPLADSQDSVYDNFAVSSDVKQISTQQQHQQHQQQQNQQQHQQQQQRQKQQQRQNQQQQQQQRQQNQQQHQQHQQQQNQQQQQQLQQQSSSFASLPNPATFTNPFRKDETIAVRSSKLPRNRDHYL